MPIRSIQKGGLPNPPEWLCVHNAQAYARS